MQPTMKCRDALTRGQRASVMALAQPKVAPRANKASILRAGGNSIAPPAQHRDLEANVALAKQRAADEKARKRASLALPTSFKEPTIVSTRCRAAWCKLILRRHRD